MNQKEYARLIKTVATELGVEPNKVTKIVLHPEFAEVEQLVRLEPKANTIKLQVSPIETGRQLNEALKAYERTRSAEFTD